MQFLIIAFIMFFGLSSHAVTREERFDLYYSQAVKAEKSGDFDTAIRKFAQAYEFDKTDSSLLTKLGLIYLNKPTKSQAEEQDNGRRAVSYFNKALEFSPSDAMINLLLAQAYTRLNETEKAYTYFKRASTIEPDNVLLTFDLALYHFEQKNFKEAIELFNRIIMAYPDHLRARSYLAASLQSTDNYLAAIEQYNYVLKYEQNDYAVHKNVADSWLALSQYENARESYKKAAQIDGNVPNIYADLAFIESKFGNYDEAVKNYQNAIKLKNEDVWHKALAKVFYLNNEKQKAIDAYLYVEDYDMAAYIQQQEGKYDEAIINYNKALEKNPDDSKTLYNIARLYYEKKNYLLATTHLQKLLQIKPNDVESLFLLASSEQQLEKYDAAISHYNEILGIPQKLDPQLKNDIHYNLAIAQKQKGDLKSSEANLEIVLADKENLAKFKKIDDLYKNLLTVKLDQDKVKEAQGIVEIALKEKPTDLNLRQTYADLLISQGKTQDAIEQLRLAIAFDNTQKSRLRLAKLLKDTQNHFDALTEYQTAVTKEPRNLEAILGTANTFKTLSLDKEAENYYARALEYYPTDYLANYNFGLLLQSQKKHKEALTYYEKVLELNPKFLENYYVLGLCYWNLKKKDKAMQLWNEFLAQSEDEETKENIQKLIQSQAGLPSKTIDSKFGLEQDEKYKIKIIDPNNQVPYYDLVS